MDRFEEMRTFSAVARRGVNGAARALHIAPSAVSRRIKELEHRLGTPLFVRSGRSMVLTESGQAFLNTSREIMDQVLEAEGRIRDAQGTLVGRLRVAAPLTFGMKYVVPALNDFLLLHPKLDLDLDLDDRRVDILREGYDLAIRVGTLADTSLKAKRLWTSPFVLAASPEFVHNNGPFDDPTDIVGLPGLVYSAKPRPDLIVATGLDGAKTEILLEPRIVANNGDAIREGAVAGLGVICEPRFIIREALDEGSLVRLLHGYEFGEVGAFLVWPQHEYMPAKLRAVIDHLADTLKPTG